MKRLDRLIKLLDLKEDEILQALLSAFAPCQPSALHGAWKRNPTYQAPESPNVFWKLFEEADFRCSEPNCKSQLRITFDHIDGNTMDSSTENLRVLCFSCNRRRHGSEITRNLNLEVYKVILDHIDATSKFPTPQQVAERLGRTPASLGGCRPLIKYLKHRYLQSIAEG